MTKELQHALVNLREVAAGHLDFVTVGKEQSQAILTALEPGVVYRKWPGEPPHCSSCDCGMTDEQKRTVPFEDYQTFHTALMAIVHESKSFTEAVRLASDALQRKTAEPASREASLGGHTVFCDHCQRSVVLPYTDATKSAVAVAPMAGWNIESKLGIICPECQSVKSGCGTP